MKEQAKKDQVTITGRVVITLTKSDGSVEVEEFDNLVVAAGKAHVAARMSSSPPAAMGWIAIGTGTNAPADGNTALQTELYREAASNTPSGSTIQYSFSAGPGEGTGPVTEAGVFNAAAAGAMMSRVTFPVKNKEAAETLGIIWTITFA